MRFIYQFWQNTSWRIFILSTNLVSSTKHFQTSFHCKGECCSLGKHGKVRLTRLAAGDAMGEKLPMIVIGKFAKPHVSVVSEAYPVVTVHKNSWMDGSSFADWVKEVNRKYASWDRKIALIINSYPPPPPLFPLLPLTQNLMA